MRVHLIASDERQGLLCLLNPSLIPKRFVHRPAQQRKRRVT